MDVKVLERGKRYLVDGTHVLEFVPNRVDPEIIRIVIDGERKARPLESLSGGERPDLAAARRYADLYLGPIKAIYFSSDMPDREAQAKRLLAVFDANGVHYQSSMARGHGWAIYLRRGCFQRLPKMLRLCHVANLSPLEAGLRFWRSTTASGFFFVPTQEIEQTLADVQEKD